MSSHTMHANTLGELSSRRVGENHLAIKCRRNWRQGCERATFDSDRQGLQRRAFEWTKQHLAFQQRLFEICLLGTHVATLSVYFQCLNVVGLPSHQ